MKPLLSPDKIATRLGQVADLIQADFRGRQITVVGILNGASIVASDLVKLLPAPLELGFMQVTSYTADAVQDPYVRVVMPPNIDVYDKHVLIVDDILDSGHSIARIRRYFATLMPASLRFFVFADKGLSNEAVDYVAFSRENMPVGFENEWVIGYGMDSSGLHRNLPGVFALDR